MPSDGASSEIARQPDEFAGLRFDPPDDGDLFEPRCPVSMKPRPVLGDPNRPAWCHQCGREFQINPSS